MPELQKVLNQTSDGEFDHPYSMMILDLERFGVAYSVMGATFNYVQHAQPIVTNLMVDFC